MAEADIGGMRVHYEDEGPRDGPALVLAHALGTDISMWDPLMPHLPPGLRVIRYDIRGHGWSEVPPAPYSMGGLVRDAEGLLDHLALGETVFLGLSLGGMIAQGLAVKRLDLIRGLILSNTAAKLGQPGDWQARAALVRREGMEAVADALMARWFTPDFAASPSVDPWRDRVLACPVEGYAGCCAAIAGTDFYTPTSGLRLPTLGLAGSDDGSTPADLVRETVDLIPGARFELIRRTGHLPHVEQPKAYAGHVTAFLRDIGHID